MKKILLTLLFLQSFHSLKAQSPTLLWAANSAGASDEVASAVAVDGIGNVYTTGTFMGTVDFDPSVGVLNLTSNGGEDVFITKLDVSGNLVWAKSIGGPSNDNGKSIAVDASGNVFVIGYFNGTADFDPNSGTTNLTSAGYSDIFIVKLVASGDLEFAKKFGGLGFDNGYSIAVDALGNFYATGYFSATVDFDPNAGVLNLSSASSSNDVFFTKYDGSGNLVWAKKVGGADYDLGKSIKVSAQGNVYATGSFSGTVDFDPNAPVLNLTSSGSGDFFIMNLDASGNLVWVKKIGGVSGDDSRDMALDSDGNCYVTGVFEETVDFDPNAGTHNLTSAFRAIFVLKLDVSGNLTWVKSFEGNGGYNDSFGIAVDGSGNVYTTGYFYDTMDFDPSAAVFNLNAVNSDAFISKLDNSGNYIYAFKIGGTGDDYGNTLATDASANLYAAGRFQSTVDFDPNDGTYNLTSAGYYDMFVIKLVPCIAPSAPTASGTTICSDNSTILSATGVGTLGWYSASTDGTYLGGGSNFSTPTLTETTSYYVQDSTCAAGPRTEVTVVVGVCTGIDENNSSSLVNIFPNPSYGKFIINTSTVPHIVFILDAVGKVVLEVKPTTTNTSIDIHHLKNGMYFISIETDQKSSMNKIIKE